MADPTAPIQHLVLGVDDGDYSWEALDLARAVADSVGAQLHAFHATTDKVPDHLIHRAKEADLPMRSTVTFPGSDGVARALIDHAADLDNAVAALTSHARRGITAALLGSTAKATLEDTTEPLLLFGPHHGEAAPISRILACIDGSELSESILPHACRWARAAGVELWLAHVVEPEASAAGGGFDSNYVHRVAEDLDTDDIDVEFDVLHGDHPGTSISDYANQKAGTLTALATHGRTGLRDVTMGSVAMEVTRKSEGPTLVVRPGGDLE